MSSNVELVQKQIGFLPKEARAEIVSLLQKDDGSEVPSKQPSPTTAEQPPADGQPAATTQSQSTSGRPQGGGKVAGQLSTDPRAVKRREQRAAKKSAATSTTGTVQQKQLTSKGFGQMVGDLTKKIG